MLWGPFDVIRTKLGKTEADDMIFSAGVHGQMINYLGAIIWIGNSDILSVLQK